MNINNPKNELYQDFVQLVDNVSTAVIKESIVPISGPMTTASESLQQSSYHIKEMSKAISSIHLHTSKFKNEIDNVSHTLSKKIDNEIKSNLSNKFNLMETKFNELQQNNNRLENQLIKFQERQDFFLYTIIGITAFFGLVIIYLLTIGVK